MSLSVDRQGLAFGATGVALVAQLALLRAVSTATDAYVTLAGRELHWACSFKSAFGIPCPNCGMTRSVVYAVHGEWGRALRMNPAGPLLVLGALVLAGVLLALMFRRRPERPPADNVRAVRKLALGAAVYGGLVAAVLLVNWMRVIT